MIEPPSDTVLSALGANAVASHPLRGMNGMAWVVTLQDGSTGVATRTDPAVADVARVAGERDVGPRVIGYRDGWLISRELPGEHVVGVAFGRPALIDAIVDLLSRWHDTEIELNDASLSESLNAYVVRAHHHLNEQQLNAADWALKTAAELEAASEHTVPCHLDVGANLFDTEHGLRLIDFDHAAMATPAQELGQLIWEAELSRTAAERLVSRYGETTGRDVAASATWSAVVGVSWAVWAVWAAEARTELRFALAARRWWERLNGHWALPPGCAL
ncbi:MAG TPA: phosphotransferase [Actinomycetes bacterium]|nr:phosphotransferase [Actinomycetes bacterium]